MAAFSLKCGSLWQRILGDVLLPTWASHTQSGHLASRDGCAMVRECSLCNTGHGRLAAANVTRCYSTALRTPRKLAQASGRRVRGMQNRTKAQVLHPCRDRRPGNETSGGAIHVCSVHTSFPASFLPRHATASGKLCQVKKQKAALAGGI